jgi:uncharacterized membrane protein
VQVTTINERLIPVRQTWAAILALVLASILSCALVVVRAYYAGTTAFLFFFWNLFLAWVPPVPYWYDIICVMAFAQTGLFVGYLSLYLMQEVIRAWMGRSAGWLFALAMLSVSAFGVYLGRFLRWNSWDALVSPFDTLYDAARVANPWNDVQPLAFSMTFFAFSLVCYLILYSFAHLHGWVQKASARPV